MSDGTIRIDTEITTDKAKKQWNDFDLYVSKGASSLANQVMTQTKKVDSLSSSYSNTVQKMREVGAEADNMALKLSQSNAGIMAQRYGTFDDLLSKNREYTKLINLASRLNDKSSDYAQRLAYAKEELYKTKSAYVVARTNQEKLENSTNRTAKNTSNIATHTGRIANGFGAGLKKLARYALALVGIRSLYMGLQRAMTSYMNSGADGAEQLKVDLDYLKLSMGNALAPVLRGILSIAYELMGVVGAIIKAVSGIDIFAKSTAKSTGKTAKNAQNTLASFDKIDVLQQDSGGDTGETELTPTDMHSFMDKWTPQIENLKKLFATIFEPFSNSWKKHGEKVTTSLTYGMTQIENLGQSIQKSLGKAFDFKGISKSVEEITDNILLIVEDFNYSFGNIVSAMNNAWNKDETGTKIIEKISNIIKNITKDFVLASKGAKDISSMVKSFTENKGVEKVFELWLKSIDKVLAVLEFASTLKFFDLFKKETWNNATKGLTKFNENIKNKLNFDDNIEKLFNPFIQMFNVVKSIKWTEISQNITRTLFSPLEKDIENIKNRFQSFIGFFTNTDWIALFSRMSNATINSFNNMKYQIDTKMSEINYSVQNSVSNISNNMINTFEQAKSRVIDIFNVIKNNISYAMDNARNKVVNTATSIRDGFVWAFQEIPNRLKSIINTILWQIEGMFNNSIRTINDKIRTLNSYSSIFRIPAVSTIGTISIPKLAKGGIVSQATPAIIGEAGKEAVVPLENNTEWMDKIAEKINGGTTVVKFSGSLSQLARILKPEIEKETIRTGNSLVSGGVF